MSKRLYRSKKNKVLSGVCGGLGDYFKVDPVIVRILLVVLAISSFGTVALIYLICSFVIPERPDDYVEEETEILDENGNKVEKAFSFNGENSKQTLGIILIIVGALIFMSRMISWFDSSMILALAIVGVGVLVLFKGNKDEK